MARIVMVLRSDIRYDGRVRKEVVTLVEAGQQVELIVSDFSKTGSGGEDLEELGVKIHYVPMQLGVNPLRNFIKQLSFNQKSASILKRLCPTHIHCHDLYSLLAGVWAREKTKANIIFDSHELMPETMGGIRKIVWNYIESRCLKSCDYIIMPENNRISYYKKKYPNIPKPLLLENFPRKRDITTKKIDLFREIYPISREQKIVLYTGSISPERYVEELIESMSMCGEEFVLVIVGRAYKGYDESIREKIRHLGLSDRVFLHEAVLHTEILQYMAACDIGVAFYRNTNLNNYYCASNKLYEYIALGKPILTNNYPGLLETIEKFRQGLCLAEITPKSLADSYIRVINPILITPGAKKFFWEDEQDILVQLYEK